MVLNSGPETQENGRLGKIISFKLLYSKMFTFAFYTIFKAKSSKEVNRDKSGCKW